MLWEKGEEENLPFAAGRIKTLSFCLSLHSQSNGASHCPVGPCRQVAQRQRICLQCRRPVFDPWVRKMPWRRKWQPTPVFSPGKSHGQRRLVGYSPGDGKESDMIEETEHTHTKQWCICTGFPSILTHCFLGSLKYPAPWKACLVRSPR